MKLTSILSDIVIITFIVTGIFKIPSNQEIRNIIFYSCMGLAGLIMMIDPKLAKKDMHIFRICLRRVLGFLFILNSILHLKQLF